MVITLALGLGASRIARAEHNHGGLRPQHHAPDHPPHHERVEEVARSSFAAGVQLVAARFNTQTYIGDYQGLTPSLAWSRARLAASANTGLYRLTENGRVVHGVGDLVVTGQVTLIQRSGAMLGLVMPISLPTGDHVTGLGMGHVMLMPAVWGATTLGSLDLGASVGYGRALGDTGATHDHGVWPLVDPMNMQEITWTATAELPLGRAIRVGARMNGGVPLDDVGHDRVVGGLRTSWTEGRVETRFELQAGLVGDPFSFRGLLESMVHF